MSQWYYILALIKPVQTSLCSCDVSLVFAAVNTQYISTGYTCAIGCPPVREDNPRALASGLSLVQADNPWYNYFIPPTSV